MKLVSRILEEDSRVLGKYIDIPLLQTNGG